MKKIMKVLAMVVIMAVIIIQCCACGNEPKTPNMVYELSDPDEKIMVEEIIEECTANSDLWYEAWVISPEGYPLCYGSVNKEWLMDRVFGLVEKGYSLDSYKCIDRSRA